jgi:hypothetical protein
MTFGQLGNFIIWLLPEFLFFYCLGLLFCNKNRLMRIVFYTSFIFFFLIYLSQAASIHMTNDLISVLALENIHFIGLIVHKKSLLLSAAAFVLGIVFFVTFTELFTDKQIKLAKKTFISIIIISFVLLTYLIDGTDKSFQSYLNLYKSTT